MYTFKPLNHDVSGEFGKEESIVTITHKISGFESGSIYLIIDLEDQAFFFGRKILDTDTESVFASIDDQSVVDLATDLITSMEGPSDEE
jgi:hypothetical protein